MKKYLTLFLTVVLFAGLTACTKNDVSEKNGVENKDKPFTINYLGQEYSFDKKAENIVLASLEGMEDAATLGVEAKGVLEVGGKVPKYLEENFKSATLVGDKMNPNSEVILGLNPSVIIGSSKFGEEVMSKLNKIAVTLPYSHISANWKDNLLALGEIMGKTHVANKVISDYEEKASKTKEELSSEYLLLDEPTTFLDMSHQLEVLSIVRNLNERHKCTIVMVLHDINHAAKYSDFIVAMKDGKILYKDEPNSIMNKEVLKNIYNIDAELITNENYNVPLCLNYELL